MNERTSSRDASPVLVLGIGNTLMGDEGVGVRAVETLQHDPDLERVVCLDGGTGGFHLLGFFQEAQQVVLVDATLDGRPAGTIRILEPRFSHEYPPSLTAHDIGLKDLLDALYLLGNPPRVKLFAVSIGEKPELGVGLSPQIEAILPELAKQVREAALDALRYCT